MTQPLAPPPLPYLTLPVHQLAHFSLFNISSSSRISQPDPRSTCHPLRGHHHWHRHGPLQPGQADLGPASRPERST